MNLKQPILYEQPVNELTRVCLRLEQLFEQIHYCFHNESLWDSREVLHALLEIINVADRPDLKSNLSKELTRQHGNLSRLDQMPNVDHSRLRSVLDELDTAITILSKMSGKFAPKLRDNEFLNTIRLQLANPGGACAINTPALNFWLNQAHNTRQDFLADWLHEIDFIRDIIGLMLRLVRDSNMAEFKTAECGFYEMALDPKHPCQLIRIEIAGDIKAYPEVSVGRHRLCIRFLEPDFYGHDNQFNEDITFKLTTCML